MNLTKITLIQSLVVGWVVLLVGCANTPNQVDEATKGQMETAKSADDLMIVDCLLPGQVRKLGAQASYLTARRPIKTTAVDCEIRGGEYVAFDRADYATALKIWLPQAQAGDAEAQNYVGEIYEKGLGILPDYEAAAHWYKLAADQQLARAQINLGNLYEKGLGVPKDAAQALNLYRMASGLKSDKLEYASSIAVASASQAELQKLKDQNAFHKRQAEDLKSQLATAKNELAQKQQALDKAEASLQSSEEKLLSAKERALDTSLSEEQQAIEVAKLQELLESERSRHDRELKEFASETMAISERRRLVIAALEEELRQQRQEVAQQKEKIESLEGEATKINSNIGQLASLDKNIIDAPTIEIIEPPMTLTRGSPTVKLRSGIRKQEIIGKVQAPAGLAMFKVNGDAQEVDNHDLFWVDVNIRAENTPINIVAIDKNGRRVGLDFAFVSDMFTGSVSPQQITQAPLKYDPTGFGKYYALVIGNNAYKHFPKLDTAENDARSTAQVLREKYGYETTLLVNADRYTILSAFNTLRQQLTEHDNLLVYYAGHGELDKVNERGYWLPVDAETDNTANWISNVAISDILNAMPAKHVMVVADSCYAGTMSSASMARLDENLAPEVRDEWISVMKETRTRTVLTSGGVAPVLDGGGGAHSIFAKAFLQVLQSNTGLLEGHSVYRDVLGQVRKAATALNQDQVPDYAPIKHAGHEAGEFFFVPVS